MNQNRVRLPLGNRVHQLDATEPDAGAVKILEALSHCVITP
jgi:hypothetical protein